MRPRGNRHVCRRCGTQRVPLDDETARHMGAWAEAHPLRGISNWPTVPLFTTTDETRLAKVLDWAKAHPGQLVPDEILEVARADESELERASIRILVTAGLLETAPHVVWTFHATGLIPTEENFDGMPPEDQDEVTAALSRWDKMTTAERDAFATKMRAYVATLPA